jgi:hypothetical protein
MRNRSALLSIALVPALLTCGCANNNTERDATAGGVIGGVTGAIVGAAAHAPLAGAAIGAASGALIGGAVGHSEDKAEQRAVADAAYRQRTALPIDQIVYMTQSHVSDTLIVNQIRASGAVYSLTGSDVAYLKGQGVSDAVVSEMQATAQRYPQPVYPAHPVYVAEPAPVAVGVGVRF